jgi:hypothetical protein
MFCAPATGGRSMTAATFFCTAAGLAISAAALAGAPDLIVGGMNGVSKWTPAAGPGGVQAYSLGLTTCNIGDAPATWEADSALHPVFGQNIHRIADGVIEQIGLGFAWHGFLPLQQSVCGACTPGDSSALGIGCSSPDTSSILGQQFALAPRSTVNAASGAVVWPKPPDNCGATPISICERIQVSESDLADPSDIYLGETVVVHFGDAAANNTGNNASYRRLLLGANFLFTTTGNLEGGSAVRAWQALNNNGSPDAGILIDQVNIPEDGVVEVGSTAIPIGNGRWRYVIAVENISSDRALAGVVVFMGADPSPQGFTFHAPTYHSGEVYNNADWPLIIGGASFRWLCPQSFAQNPNANALRWGTLYTFTFTSTAAPVEGNIALNIFKPGAINGVGASAIVPGAVSSYCPGDANNDGIVNFFDLNLLLGTYGQVGIDLPGDANGDGEIGFDDLNLFLGQFGLSC